MTISVEDIAVLLADRRGEKGVIMETARLISRHYNNEIAVPLPELNEKEPAAVANLIAQGIDQHALRVASTLPDVDCPPIKVGPTFEQRAKLRRKAAYGWFEINSMDLFMKKRARHLVAYAGSPIWVRPDRKLRQPKWEVRSPLETYTAPMTDPLDFRPLDAIFTFARTFKWLTKHYPMQAQAVLAMMANDKEKPTPDSTVECAQYLDDQELVLIAIGSGRLTNLRREANYGIAGETITMLTGQGKGTWAMELERVPNLAGVCPVVGPTRISLDGPKGQFDDTTGIYQMQARMMALEVNAVARSIYPDLWFVKDPNSAGSITRVADGLMGVIGEAEGGSFHAVNMQPGAQTMNTINYLERSLRQDSAMPADFGGESATNIRTDRRGQAVLAATVDFFIDEHQKILARSVKAELEIAAAIDMAYYGKTAKSFYVQWGKNPGRVDYTPDDLWAEDRTFIVNFTYSGLDANAKTIAVGQEIGLGILSKESGMEQNPHVQDVQREKARVIGEGLEQALMAGIQAQAQSGQISPTDIGRIIELMRPGNITLEVAVAKVQAEAQARQASSGPPGTPEGAVAPGSPEAQPGLAQPGMGAEQPTVAPPPAGSDNLRHMLQTLQAGRGLANVGG